MGRVRLCVGNYAKNPYLIRSSGVRLYSLEELCYYLSRHAVFFDEEMITQELFKWIGEELGLTDLSKSLQTLWRGNNPPEAYVQRIMEACCYCGRDQLAEVLKIVRENADLDSGEKKKRRIDHLAQTGRRKQALVEYRRLLAGVEGKDIALTASIYNAMGCIEAGMFHFPLAEIYFEKAYRLTYRKESLRYYACAVRMHGTRQEQERKLAASPELRALAAEVDARIAAYREEWRQSDAYAKVKELKEQWEDKRKPEYYEQVEEIMSQMKEDYRKQCE